MNKLHQFVKQFVSDESFRRVALENPEWAFAQHGLSLEERRSAGRICLRGSGAGTMAIARPTEFWV